MPQRLRTLLGLALFVVLTAVSLQAQNGRVSGSVKQGDEAAAFVSVRVTDTQFGTLTDDAGQFSMELPAGKYQLSIVALGTKGLKIDFEVKSGEKVSLGELLLEEDNSLYLDEVRIEGKLEEGEKRSTQMTKLSPNAVVVVSAETAAKLPDKNGAEVVGRIPGVVMERDQGEGRYISFRGTPSDWSAARINGDRLPVADEDNNSRALNFDVLPTSLIEYAVVARTLTPDMEGDNIGGSVDFHTRFVPDKTTLQATLSGGYNAQAQKPMVNGSTECGTKFEPFVG